MTPGRQTTAAWLRPRGRYGSRSPKADPRSGASASAIVVPRLELHRWRGYCHVSPRTAAGTQARSMSARTSAALGGIPAHQARQPGKQNVSLAVGGPRAAGRGRDRRARSHLDRDDDPRHHLRLYRGQRPRGRDQPGRRLASSPRRQHARRPAAGKPARHQPWSAATRQIRVCKHGHQRHAHGRRHGRARSTDPGLCRRKMTDDEERLEPAGLTVARLGWHAVRCDRADHTRVHG